MQSKTRLLHPIETLLEDLPVFQSLNLLHRGLVDLRFSGVLRWFVHLVENSKMTRERFVGELVSRQFVRDVVVRGDRVENAALARIGGIERAFIKLNAFAQALNEAEAVVIHR